MEAWLKSLGPGRFTCGAKYICFLPKTLSGGEDSDYQKLMQAPDGLEDDQRWNDFAESMTDHLNDLLP